MLIVKKEIIKDKEYITKIENFPNMYKNFESFKLVVENRKPLNVIELFLKEALKGEFYSKIDFVESEYANILNQNTKEVVIDSNYKIDVIDLENIPEEALRLEEEYPHLKDFRLTLEYVEPELKLDEFIPENFDEYKKLVRDYNRYFHEEYILEQGYKPLNYDFKVYCKSEDLASVKNALELVKIQGALKFPLIVYGGSVVNLDIDEVDSIIKEAALYNSLVFTRKVLIRESYIKPASNAKELIEACNTIREIKIEDVIDVLAEQLNIESDELASSINLDYFNNLFIFI